MSAREPSRGATGSTDRRSGPDATRATPGQMVIEMAFAITVILLLLVGLAEFAPVVVRTAQLTQSVREGVAYGRNAPTDTFGIRKRVVQAAPVIYGAMTDAQISAMTAGQIAVACTSGLGGAAIGCGSAGIGDSVTVTATLTYQLITPLFSGLLDAPLSITQSATSGIY